MYGKIKIIVQFIVFVLSINVFGQNPEYAYLVKTEITGYLHANNGSLSIKTNLGGIGSGNYFATASNVGNVYFDFMQLQDGFTQSTISIYNYAIRIANYPDCDYTREETILKEDFNNRSYLNYGGCSFQQRVYPLHIVGTDNTDPVCSLTTINLKGGYDWEYQIGNGGWKTLASATQSVNINIGDIYADNGIDINELPTGSAERSIHFQTGHKASNKFVARRTYTITGCSPVFVEYYDKTKTSCFYKTDGNIGIKLGRNIDSSKERLVVTLYKSDRVLIGQEHTTNSLIPLNSTNYGYMWPNNIDAGTYYFLYQTQNINLDIPTAPEIDDGSSWDKLVKTPSFTIEKATNVDFTAAPLNDESCFEIGDGEIQLEVTSGEAGRSYLYIVYKIEGTTEILERDWTSFSGTSTTINGLSKGKYRIKVKDSQGCLAK
ncbi:hypothetical protein [Tenacibaculum larymnensis]|uniref:SprB repeat-containing protein n=1 Tax=Tenacibaculum larymnensis TaxID=2878201 RepID=A0A9X4ESV4_9FLAO|nr:hypothetical protein [Tenacibaculum larymnensis]MDE1207630.1 hypothetical protein [Tenacibaculum larymnensis]